MIHTVTPSFLRPSYSNSRASVLTRYNNDYVLRVGTVVAAYAPKDDGNYNKSVYEYDVEVSAADGGQEPTPVMYLRCRLQTGFGGLADRFLWSPRVAVRDKDTGNLTEPGSRVLLACINGVSRQAHIIGAVDPEGSPEQDAAFAKGPRLSWEYNGIAALIDKDGALSVSRRGPTDSKGKVSNSTGAGAKVTFGKDGEIVISTGDGKEVLTFDEQGGTVKLNANSGAKIEVAGGQLDVQASLGVKLGGVEPLVKGTTHMSLWMAFLGQMTAYAGQMQGAAQTLQSSNDPMVQSAAPQITAAYTTLTAALATLMSTLNTSLSSKNTTD